MKRFSTAFLALALLALFVATFLTGRVSAQGGYVPNARDTIPAQDCELVTPSDSEDIRVSRLVIVGSGGALKVLFNSGRTFTIPAAIAVDGFSAPLVIKRVFSTGTTASIIMVCR